MTLRVAHALPGLGAPDGPVAGPGIAPVCHQEVRTVSRTRGSRDEGIVSVHLWEWFRLGYAVVITAPRETSQDENDGSMRDTGVFSGGDSPCPPLTDKWEVSDGSSPPQTENLNSKTYTHL